MRLCLGDEPSSCLRLYCLTVKCTAVLDDIATVDDQTNALDVVLNLGILLLLFLACALWRAVAKNCAAGEREKSSHLIRLLCASWFAGMIMVWRIACLRIRLGTACVKLHDSASLSRVASDKGLTRHTALQNVRIVLCFAGVIARSIRLTWPTVEARVLRPLREHGASKIDIYVFNIDTQSASVDGNVAVNASDAHLIPHNVYESMLQNDVDRLVSQRCASMPPGFSCKFSYYAREGADAKARQTVKVAARRQLNAMRQLYSEARIGHFLVRRLTKYDVALVIGPDMFLALNISIADVLTASRSLHSIVTSLVCDAGRSKNESGITNGFYIGHPLALANVLLRLEQTEHWRSTDPPFDYESLVRRSFDHHGQVRKPTTMVFFKIRADGKVEWQGTTRGGAVVSHLASPEDREAVSSAWRLALTGRTEGPASCCAGWRDMSAAAIASTASEVLRASQSRPAASKTWQADVRTSKRPLT